MTETQGVPLQRAPATHSLPELHSGLPQRVSRDELVHIPTAVLRVVKLRDFVQNNEQFSPSTNSQKHEEQTETGPQVNVPFYLSRSQTLLESTKNLLTPPPLAERPNAELITALKKRLMQMLHTDSVLEGQDPNAFRELKRSMFVDPQTGEDTSGSHVAVIDKLTKPVDTTKETPTDTVSYMRHEFIEISSRYYQRLLEAGIVDPNMQTDLALAEYFVHIEENTSSLNRYSERRPQEKSKPLTAQQIRIIEIEAPSMAVKNLAETLALLVEKAKHEGKEESVIKRLENISELLKTTSTVLELGAFYEEESTQASRGIQSSPREKIDHLLDALPMDNVISLAEILVGQSSEDFTTMYQQVAGGMEKLLPSISQAALEHKNAQEALHQDILATRFLQEILVHGPGGMYADLAISTQNGTRTNEEGENPFDKHIKFTDTHGNTQMCVYLHGRWWLNYEKKEKGNSIQNGFVDKSRHIDYVEESMRYGLKDPIRKPEGITDRNKPMTPEGSEHVSQIFSSKEEVIANALKLLDPSLYPALASEIKLAQAGFIPASMKNIQYPKVAMQIAAYQLQIAKRFGVDISQGSRDDLFTIYMTWLQSGNREALPTVTEKYVPGYKTIPGALLEEKLQILAQLTEGLWENEARAFSPAVFGQSYGEALAWAHSHGVQNGPKLILGIQTGQSAEEFARIAENNQYASTSEAPLTAIDLQPRNISVEAPVSFEQHNALATEYPDASFSLVFTNFLLPNLQSTDQSVGNNQGKLLKEIGRILRPGGCAVMVESLTIEESAAFTRQCEEAGLRLVPMGVAKQFKYRGDADLYTSLPNLKPGENSFRDNNSAAGVCFVLQKK